MLYGSQRSFIDLAEKLTELGARFFCVELAPSFARLRRVPYRSLEINPSKLTLLKVTLFSIKFVIRHKCDAVYAYHIDRLNSIIPALITSFFTGRPLFLGVHDDWKKAEDRQGFVSLLAHRITTRPGLRALLLYAAFHLSRRLACRVAKACFTPNNYVAEYARKYLHAKRAWVIGRGVNEFWFNPSNVPKIYDAVFVGRIDPRKGIDTLLRAWKEVVNTKPDAKLLMIGSGWDKHLMELRNQAESLKISKNIVAKGYLSNPAEIRDLLSASRMFVLPTLAEGVPRAVVEAMAGELPCILSDIPPLRENFLDCAMFVQPGNHLQLYGAISLMMRDAETSKELAKLGRERVSRFEWGDVASRAWEIINTR